MSLQSFPIVGLTKGFQNNVKPAMLPDNAWQLLENAYVFRERVLKREGRQFLGRLRRIFTSITESDTSAGPPATYTFYPLTGIGIEGAITGATQANPCKIKSVNHNLTNGTEIIIMNVGGMTELNGNTYTITVVDSSHFTIGVNSTGYTAYTSGGNWIVANEPQAEIEAGSVVITVGAPDTATFTDNGNGTFSVTGAGVAAGSYINYSTGYCVLQFTSLTGGASVTANFNYFPTLPCLAIPQREIPTINDEQTVWFDTKYAYIWNGTGFQEFITGTTWNGADYNLYWCYNYRGTNPQDRLFFVTNDVVNGSNPIRYTDGSTWTDFKPILTATNIVMQDLGTVTTPWTSFSGTLTTPIIPGSVSISVGNVSFTDVNEDGTLTGNPVDNTGTIDYVTGDIVLSFSPAFSSDTEVYASYSTSGTTFLCQCSIIVAYYGRLLALNTWEGADYGSAVNIFNRCRFSQLGSPIDPQAWRSDIFGRGGFLDAPVNEQITGATFIKNTLVVDFERSTWQLRYVGEYGLPFIWERVSADFGCESTFSGVLFDNHRLAIGDKAITAASGNSVDRIDLEIPDEVFAFKNANNGVERITGIRDYKRELVFWNYPDSQVTQAPGQDFKFPNKVLLYNYRNRTWAIFRDSITAFGTFQSSMNVTWDSLEIFWDSDIITWDDPDTQSLFPLIICGDQQGFISVYGDASPSQLSRIDANEQETLTIQSVDISSSPIVFTSVDHNLLNNEIIYIYDMNWLDGTSFAALTTTLNNQIYQVQPIDDDNFLIFKWNGSNYGGNFPYSFSPSSDNPVYVGGGKIALFPKYNILTKDINIFQSKSLQTKLSRIDFQMEPEVDGQLAVYLWLNATTSGTTPGTISGNSAVGNQILGIDPTPGFYNQGSQYLWFRFYATLSAQYFSINLTYNDQQMNTLATHSDSATLYGINAWCRPGGKNVF